jgi:hypothetical protein
MVLSMAPTGGAFAVSDDNGDGNSFSVVMSDASHGTNRYLTTANSNAFNVLMYNNMFSSIFGDQHMSGIELILHGDRIATNGDIHYLPTPEQWDATPAPTRGAKRFDSDTNTITVPMTFAGSIDGTLGYELVGTPEPGGIELSVRLTTDMPADLVGKARFNLEFVPSKYRTKSFMADTTGDGAYDAFGIFPLHPQDPLVSTERPNLPTQAEYVKQWNEDRGDSQPIPFAAGYKFGFAPEDDLHSISIVSDSGEMELFDGRNRSQNGWFVLSGLITSGKAGDTIIKWHIRPQVKEGWVSDPLIAFNQAGYLPLQEKLAVIELDKWDNDYPSEASLLHVNADGSKDTVYTAPIADPPVPWQRYKYAKFDFTSVTDEGMYVIRYAGKETEIFPIAKTAYDKSWQNSLSFMAVQMDHIEVREGYRVWHAASHMEDASLGPLGQSLFDGTSSPATLPQAVVDRGLKIGEFLPGLNQGGWYDAGDFDIMYGEQDVAVIDLLYAAEAFDNMAGYDTLSVEWDETTGGLAEMHKPDGVPDIVQQVKHGVMNLLAQYETFGGVSGHLQVPRLRQYTHLGDGADDTDGFLYDPNLDYNDIVERDGKVYSGRPDDRWVMLGGRFPSTVTGNLSTCFAGAAYLLRDYYPDYAQRCMDVALDIWDRERAGQPANTATEWNTLIQLILAADKFGMDDRLDYFKDRLASLAPSTLTAANMAARYNAVFVMDIMGDEYRAAVESAVRAHAATINPNTPFGVPLTGNAFWGNCLQIMEPGRRAAIMYQYFPDVAPLKACILNSANYMLGMHPVNNTSLVTGIGTKSFTHPYNSNRADEGYIPGSIAPGQIVVAPDFVESMDDFTFLWFENEAIITHPGKFMTIGLASSRIAGDDEPAPALTKDFSKDYMMQVKKTSANDGYLETPGFNVMMYSTLFSSVFGDQHCAGIELIQSGRRIATNGDIHLLPTPEQWDATPAPVRGARVFDEENDTITVPMNFPAETTGNPSVAYSLIAQPEPGGVKLTVKLDKPLPDDMLGKAGFNLEFIPSQFIGKSFQADGDGDGQYDAFGVFPLLPEDEMEDVARARTADQLWYVKEWNEQRGDAQPLPIAVGKKMTFAAEDDENRIRIASDVGDLELYDGRNRAQNGWFVLRTLIPEGASEIVWHISADVEADWTRAPNVTYNQAGYAPGFSKTAVIELDPRYSDTGSASLLRLNADGTYSEVFQGPTENPRTWLRYKYVDFDFSAVNAPGMYAIEYGGEKTGLFPISQGVYDDTWQASLSGFMAAQMDHMKVRDAYRIWHGASHMDDALMGPYDTVWFDGWQMGPESVNTSPYEPGEHIPGLDVGGWYDAGDFDIQVGSNLAVINDLVIAAEEFGMGYDTMTVDWDAKDVEMHRPDGVPDLVQQVKQGILQIIAQLEQVGFLGDVLEVPTLRQYTHLGSGSSDTDGYVYDAALGVNERDGLRSGVKDDRYFISRNGKTAAMQFNAATALAGASYALKEHDSSLAAKCLALAEKIWDEESHSTGGIGAQNEWNAALQLLIATDGGEAYKERVLQLSTSALSAGQMASNGWKAVLILPYMDDAFKSRLEAGVRAYLATLDAQLASNPFGVPSTYGMWGGSQGVADMGVRMYFLYKAFPEIVGTDYTLRATDYILGTHPYTNTSWVSGVGTKSTELAYGSNRADNSYINGGMVPGYVNVAPDFPEALDDFQYLWFENEYTIGATSKWILLGSAASAITSATYPVTVVSANADAAGSGDYKIGDTVSISAGTALGGERFVGWTASPEVALADASSADTTFVMPQGAVTVTAAFESIKPGVDFQINMAQRISLRTRATYRLEGVTGGIPYEFTSSNPGVVRVDQTGLVTAVRAGTATVSLKLTDGSGRTASAMVVVTP